MSAVGRTLVASVLIAAGLLPLRAGPAEDPFPRFDELSGHVEFWRRVFSEWTLSQVAVHHLDQPGLVYEVVALPGTTRMPYTEAQLDFLEDVREGWADRLETLAGKVASGAELTTEESELRDRLVREVGADALITAHEKVRTQRGLRERFLGGLKTSGRYVDRFREIFAQAGLPEELAYLPHVESSFDLTARSSAGASGMWQFTRSTGRLFLRINSAIDERLDPVAAAEGASRYLARAYERLGSWPLALTSYNHGLGGMVAAQERFGNDFPRIVREHQSRTFGFASKNFYAEFLAALDLSRDPERWFGDQAVLDLPLDLEPVILPARSTPASLARRYGVPLDRLASLNPAWSSRAVRRGYAIPAGTTMWLPAGTSERVDLAADGTMRHVVQRGESLSRIGRVYGVTVARLVRWNGLGSDAEPIHPGQELIVGQPVAGEPLPEFHRVERGDTLSEIAELYGVGLSELRKLNGIRSRKGVIHVGQKLRLAPPEYYVVRRGDSLSRIAQNLGIRLAQLLEANGLSLSSTIYPGQRLTLPR